MTGTLDFPVSLARRAQYALWLVLALSVCTFVLALPDVHATPADRESTIVVGAFQVLPSLTVALSGTLIAVCIPALRFHNLARRVLVAALQVAGFLCLAVLAFMLILILQPSSVPFRALSPIFVPGLLLYSLLAAIAFSLAFFLTRPRVRALFSSPPAQPFAV